MKLRYRFSSLLYSAGYRKTALSWRKNKVTNSSPIWTLVETIANK